MVHHHFATSVTDLISRRTIQFIYVLSLLTLFLWTGSATPSAHIATITGNHNGLDQDLQLVDSIPQDEPFLFNDIEDDVHCKYLLMWRFLYS